MSIWQLIRYPGVAAVLLIYNYIMLLAYTFTAVNPVFMYTPIRLGGLGFSPELIAIFTGIAGASQAAWLLLAFPPLHKRLGTGSLLWWCTLVWPIFFAANPAYNLLLWHGQKAFFWSTAPPTLILGSGVAISFGTLFLHSAESSLIPNQ